MKSLSISILMLLSIVKLQAQNLQGRVLDGVTGLGIPFVSVGVLGTNIATVSNENGDFVLKPTSFPVKLRLSHVSYLLSDLNVASSDDLLVVKLTPASISLNLVTIDPYQGQRIIKAALEKAKANSNQTFYGNAFYRQLTSVNDRPTQIYELFYDLKWNNKRVQGWNATQSRFAELNDGLSFSLNNQSYLTFSYSGYALPEKGGKFINLSTLSDYTIVVEQYIDQVDQKIAVISCKFKNAKRKQYYVNSTYYVGVDDHKIFRLENNVYNLPIKISDGANKYPPAVSTIATFNGNGSDISVLESVATKFFLKIDARGRELTSNVSSLLTVYKLDDGLKTKEFASLDKKTRDKKVVESVAYNPNFWKDNPIVKQTSLEDSFIKMMESKQAFGTMINP